jgi:hypothetical protein
MSYRPQIERIKDLMQTKGTVNKHPENGLEAVVVKEQKIGKSYSAAVGVGMSGGFGGTRYFEISGNVWEDQFNKFTDNALRIEPSQILKSPGLSYFCVTFAPGFIRKVDEAKWENKFNSLDDLIVILDKL